MAMDGNKTELDLAKNPGVWNERRGGVFFLAKSIEDLI